MIEYYNTPDEAQLIATIMQAYLREKRYRVQVEVPFESSAPLRTTLTCKKGNFTLLVEAQKEFRYDRSLKDLASWLALHRYNGQLFIATDGDTQISPRILEELEVDGVGLYSVRDGAVGIIKNAKIFGHLVSLNPDLSYGSKKAKVIQIFKKYNEGDRLGAARDLCEMIEGLTKQIAAKGKEKGVFHFTGNLNALPWANLIDALASGSNYSNSSKIIIGESLKIDLHSLRTARNMFDHPARTRREEDRRAYQFAERIMMGARLVSELQSIRRRLN